MTLSDIEFSQDKIDFGFCTVFESVRQTITITNKSVLPQKYGFCGVPEVRGLFTLSAFLSSYSNKIKSWTITVIIITFDSQYLELIDKLNLLF